MSGETPVVPGRLYGLREWRLVAPHRLAPAFGGGPWEAGTTTARCTVGGAHPAPAPGCSCGLYALHPTLANARLVLATDRDSVAGVVEAWGEVDVHETGFRAERARPHALIVPPGASRGHAERVRRAAWAHGAAVLELGSSEELHEHCHRHGLGLDPKAIRELLAPERWAERRRRLARGVLAGVASVVVGVPALVGALALARSIDWSLDAPAAAPSPLRLQILEQALVDADGDDLYVAVVRNPSRSRAALRAYPTGEFADPSGEVVGWPDEPPDVDNRPSLAPGQIGVVYDFVESLDPLAGVSRSFASGSSPMRPRASRDHRSRCRGASASSAAAASSPRAFAAPGGGWRRS